MKCLQRFQSHTVIRFPRFLNKFVIVAIIIYLIYSHSLWIRINHIKCTNVITMCMRDKPCINMIPILGNNLS